MPQAPSCFVCHRTMYPFQEQGYDSRGYFHNVCAHPSIETRIRNHLGGSLNRPSTHRHLRARSPIETHGLRARFHRFVDRTRDFFSHGNSSTELSALMSGHGIEESRVEDTEALSDSVDQQIRESDFDHSFNLFLSLSPEQRREFIMHLLLVQLNRAAENENVIYTSSGHELQDLVSFLYEKPLEKFLVSYSERGEIRTIDNGGPTRQLYNEATKTLLNDPELFIMNSSTRYLYVHENVDLQKFYYLGMILGRIANQTVSMAVDTSLSPEFFSTLLKAIEFQKSHQWTSVRDEGGLSCAEDLSSHDYRNLINDFDPKTYTKSSNRQFLKSLELDNEAKSYYDETIAPYMAIAEGMAKTCIRSFSKSDELFESIQGIQSLKAKQKELVKYKGTSEISDGVLESVAHLFDRYIQSADESQLRHLCERMTGASGIQDNKQIEFNVTHETQRGSIIVGTCGKNLNFSLPSFIYSYNINHDQPLSTEIDLHSKSVQDFFEAELHDSLGQHFNEF